MTPYSEDHKLRAIVFFTGSMTVSWHYKSQGRPVQTAAAQKHTPKAGVPFVTGGPSHGRYSSGR